MAARCSAKLADGVLLLLILSYRTSTRPSIEEQKRNATSTHNKGAKALVDAKTNTNCDLPRPSKGIHQTHWGQSDSVSVELSNFTKHSDKVVSKGPLHTMEPGRGC